MRSAVFAASMLIEDILDIARIEACKLVLKREPLDFLAFVEQLVQMFRPQAEAKGLAFRCQAIDPLPRRIRGDEKRVGQILINLLGNAVKFTRHGEILFRVGYSGEIASFQVVDTGEGIAAEHFDDIFQPFHRVGPGDGNAVSGAGLGLTISKILAEIMGGELTVESEPGQGSTFSVRVFLPDMRGTEDAADDDVSGYHGPRRRVLVVDGQPEHRKLIRSALEPLGFDVAEAGNGAECLAECSKVRPDLIFMDIVMPDTNGIEAARRLRAEACRAPIVVVSANAYPGDRKQACDAGCDDFLAKPIQIAELLRKVKLHLGLDWIYRKEEDGFGFHVSLQWVINRNVFDTSFGSCVGRKGFSSHLGWCEGSVAGGPRSSVSHARKEPALPLSARSGSPSAAQSQARNRCASRTVTTFPCTWIAPDWVNC